MQTDCIGGCEKKVNTERSKALLGTTNLFRKLRREESAAKERSKAKMLLNLRVYYCRTARTVVPLICHFLQELYGRTVRTVRP